MLPALFHLIRKPKFESYMLLILSPEQHLTYVHTYPGLRGHIDTEVKQETTSILPCLVDFESRIQLGKLAVPLPEDQNLEDIIDRLKECCQKARKTSINHSEDSALLPDKAKLQRVLGLCEQTLRQGFSLLKERETTPDATAKFYTVNLVRISKPEQGVVSDLHMKRCECRLFTVPLFMPKAAHAAIAIDEAFPSLTKAFDNTRAFDFSITEPIFIYFEMVARRQAPEDPIAIPPAVQPPLQATPTWPANSAIPGAPISQRPNTINTWTALPEASPTPQYVPGDRMTSVVPILTSPTGTKHPKATEQYPPTTATYSQPTESLQPSHPPLHRNPKQLASSLILATFHAALFASGSEVTSFLPPPFTAARDFRDMQLQQDQEESQVHFYWRMLTASSYRGMPDAQKQAYLSTRAENISKAVDAFTAAFRLFANPQYLESERIRHPTKVMEDTAELGIWLFEQPCGFEFIWSNLAAGQVVISPTVVKVSDEHGELLQATKTIVKADTSCYI
ncbi:hypothetical protein A7C99_1496 [Trichophyton rubrum]|uniref:Uncharacterized protein n=1 Tax=Trichophyton rubrum TaxID=5551 RepID=A0A178F434_TRIRU|nr:hypothetical protein A7C99_1496 [Trichophyton rubrum]